MSAELKLEHVHFKLDRQNFPAARLPEYGSKLASGMDLFSAEDAVIMPFQPVIVHTGVHLAYLDERFEIQVRPRSGNSAKRRFNIANQPGTVDADYRGEIGVIVLSFNVEFPGASPGVGAVQPVPLQIKAGERIAQLVVCPVVRPQPVEARDVVESERGDRGYGSTGR